MFSGITNNRGYIIVGLMAAIAGTFLVIACIFWIPWSDFNCPKGQTTTVITYVPITVGKTVVLSPIYGCEK